MTPPKDFRLLDHVDALMSRLDDETRYGSYAYGTRDDPELHYHEFIISLADGWDLTVEITLNASADWTESGDGYETPYETEMTRAFLDLIDLEAWLIDPDGEAVDLPASDIGELSQALCRAIDDWEL